MPEHTISDQDILSLFMKGAEKLQAVLQAIPPVEFDSPCEESGWSIRQIIHHIADDCDVWSMCIKKAIATPGILVRFEGFPGNEAWAEALEFKTREIETALSLILAHRRYLGNLLQHYSDSCDRTV